MTAQSRTFRIFVSSTFSDLKAERDALQARVFPALRDFCAERGVRFQAIDLRWGVSQEASRDQQTMNICLGEIERCQEVTPRPNFIVLLGDRYGWCPPPPQVPAYEFEQILRKVPGNGKALLAKWYRRDDNAVPVEYGLQPWDDIEYDAWTEIEMKLQARLARAAKTAGLDEAAQFRYWASATHQEIVAGALSPKAEAEHVFAFFRRFSGIPRNSGAKDYLDLDEGGSRDTDAQRRLGALKAELKGKLGGNVKEYGATWTEAGPTTDHVSQLCNDVGDALKGVIKRQLDELEAVDPLEAEIVAHQEFGRERARFFTGRAAILGRIAGYVEGSETCPLAIWGEPGSGKSALLARVVQEAEETHPGAAVLYRFIGATPDSSSGRALLESLCRQVSRCYGGDESDIQLDYKELSGEFVERLGLATAQKPLILLLDALDQLSDADNARNLAWLPKELPKHVRMVVSTLPGECWDALNARLDRDHLVPVEPMPEAEAQELLGLWLDDAGRTLQPSQHAHLLERFAGCPKPLFLKLAHEETRRWHSYDGLPGLNDDIPGIIGDLFARLSAADHHGELLVSRGLGYLAAARNGLTEDELLDLLARDVDVYAWFLRNLFHTPPDLLQRAQGFLQAERGGVVSEEEAEAWLGELRQAEDEGQLRSFLSAALSVEGGLRLPVVLWSRLYAELAPYLTERAADGTSLLTFYHPTTFGQAVRERYLPQASSAERHQALARYFQDQPLQWVKNEAEAANLRKLSELPFQQAYGELWSGVQDTLLDFDFLKAKVTAFGPHPLIEDFKEAYRAGYKPKDISLVQNALELSEHVLVEDHGLLWSQLFGRLLTADRPEVQTMLSRAPEGPWLRPLTPVLTQVGGPLLRTLSGHSDYVTSVHLTHDGRFAVSSSPRSKDRSLRVWDIQTGQNIQTIEGITATVLGCLEDGKTIVYGRGTNRLVFMQVPSGEPLADYQGRSTRGFPMAVTPDGRLALSQMHDKTLHLWEIGTGKTLQVLEGHRYLADAVAIARDGQWAVSVNRYTNSTKVWDLRTGQEHLALKTDWKRREGVSGRAVAIAPDGDAVISEHGSGRLCVWDIRSGEILHLFRERASHVRALAVSEDGDYVLSTKGQDLVVWNVESGGSIGTLVGHTGLVNAISFSRDGRLAVSAANDNTLKVWDLGAVRISKKGEKQSEFLTGLVQMPDGKRAISTHMRGKRRRLVIWDLETGNPLNELENPRLPGVGRVTPDGRYTIVGCPGGFQVFDLETGRAIQRTPYAHTGKTELLDLTPDGRHVVTVTRNDKHIKIWDLTQGKGIDLQGPQGEHIMDGLEVINGQEILKPVHILEGDTTGKHVFSLRVTRDGQRIVSTATDDTVKIWDLATGSLLTTLRGHEPGNLRMVELSPDGRYAISGDSFNEILKAWHIPSRSCLYTLEEHMDLAAVTPDGDGVIVVSARKEMELLDLTTGRLIHSFEQCRGRVFGILISPDGKFIVARSDSSIAVWALKSGRLLTSFRVDHRIKGLQLSNDGRMILFANRGQVHFLRLENMASEQ